MTAQMVKRAMSRRRTVKDVGFQSWSTAMKVEKGQISNSVRCKIETVFNFHSYEG